MAKKQRRIEPGATEPDLTPMIDCVFQLIIFFMLTAQMASDQAKLILPKPKNTIARINKKVGTDNVEKNFKGMVINVPTAYGDDEDARKDLSPADRGKPKHVKIGTEEIRKENHEMISNVIKARLDQAKKDGVQLKDFYVELRVDKDVQWGYIRPLMQLASEAGAIKVVFTALADKEAPINQ